MKKILLYGSTAAVLMLLASCNTDTTEPSVPATRTITRTFPVDETVYTAQDTRTAYENGQIGFTNNEKLGAYVWTDAGASANAGMATRTAGMPSTVTVTHNALSNGVEYNYVFVYPYKYNNSLYRNTPTVVLNNIQHPTPTTFDPVQDILVSKPVKVTGNGGTTTSEALPEIQFKRLFTFFRLKIDRSKFTGDIKLADGEKIRSVTITAPEGTQLAGTARVDIDEAYDATTCKFTIPTNAITADYGTDSEAFNTDGTFDVWFVVNPVTFNGLTIEVRTSAQTITQTFNEQVALDFKATGINALTFQPVNNNNILTSTTPIPQDYFKEGVEIEGVIYSETSAGKTNQTANTADQPIKWSSTFYAYFLNDDNDYNFVSDAVKYLTSGTVFIGRYADKKTKLKFLKPIHLRNREGTFAFKNLDIDATEVDADYLFTVTSSTSDLGGAKTLIFEDCNITFGKEIALFAPYTKALDSYIENIIFRNCTLRYEPGSKEYALIRLSDQKNAYITTGLANFKSLDFENNVIYSITDNTKPVSLFAQEVDTGDGALENLQISFVNNTVIDFMGYGTGIYGAYFTVQKFNNIQVARNIFYSNGYIYYPTITRIRHNYNADGTWPTYDLGRTNNIFFGAAGWKQFDNNYIMPSDIKSDNSCTRKNESPLSEYDPANGVFKTTSACDGFGSTLLY